MFHIDSGSIESCIFSILIFSYGTWMAIIKNSTPSGRIVYYYKTSIFNTRYSYYNLRSILIYDKKNVNFYRILHLINYELF